MYNLINIIYTTMRRAAAFIKKYWKNFDDSLINPPK